MNGGALRVDYAGLMALVVLVIPQLAVEVEINEMGVSGEVIFMIDFDYDVFGKRVVTQFDAPASENEIDFVKPVVKTNRPILAHGSFYPGVEKFFQRLRGLQKQCFLNILLFQSFKLLSGKYY